MAASLQLPLRSMFLSESSKDMSVPQLSPHSLLRPTPWKLLLPVVGVLWTAPVFVPVLHNPDLSGIWSESLPLGPLLPWHIIDISLYRWETEASNLTPGPIGGPPFRSGPSRAGLLPKQAWLPQLSRTLRNSWSSPLPQQPYGSHLVTVPHSGWTTFLLLIPCFFSSRNVFTVKAKEKATFVYHMKKTVLLWDSAKPQTKKKRKMDLPWATKTKGRRNCPQPPPPTPTANLP